MFTEDTKFRVSVSYETFNRDDIEGGYLDPAQQRFEIAGVIVDCDELIGLAQDYGIAQMSASEPSPYVWFISVDPEYSRDFFGRGLEKYYSLFIHQINGRTPSSEEMADVAALLGIKP